MRPTGLSAAAVTAMQAPISSAAEPQLETRNYMIPSDTAGIELFIRNKRPGDVSYFGTEKTLVYVHGATYPSETAFDLPIEGVSMMELIAARGYDVYLVDVRGYGGSTRPPQMSRPATENGPIVTTEVAARDLGSAVDHILKERDLASLNVMGWSWGTAIAGTYTSQNNAKVNRLVLYAPLYTFGSDTALALDPGAAAAASLPAYRLVSKASARERWLKDVPEDKKAELIPPGVFEAWADATWATDPEAGNHNPPMLRVPNGVISDIVNYWSKGRASYDPGKITVPTFLIHAEWDADLPSEQAHGYFRALTHAPYKRLVEIGEGTHTVMLEKNRMQFFRELINFLDEPSPQALR
jgi:pimeloyl-ACP methyl ester carboxylesterase